MSSTSPEALFSADENVVKAGGRFVAAESDFPYLAPFFEAFHTRATIRTDSITKGIRPGTLTPWVYFDFVNNTLLDAMAFRNEDHNFIGVYMGTPLLLFDIFNRMLSCSDVFPFIGDPAVEADSPSYFVPKLYSDADFIEQVLEDGVVRYAFDIPKYPLRAEFAMFLTCIAMDFLVSHEFAHIAGGHLLLSEQEGGFPLMSEARWHASKGETPILQQALEWDADYQATGWELRLLFVLCDDRNQIPILWRPFFKGHVASLYIWCFAVNTLLALMGNGNYQVEKLPSNSHPPPSIRQAAISDAVRSYVFRHRPSLLKQFDETRCVFEDTNLTFKGLTLCASLDVSRLVALFTGANKLDVTGLAESMKKESETHFQLVTDKLKEIRPNLYLISQYQGVKASIGNRFPEIH